MKKKVSTLQRNPPREIIMQLLKEVNFGCPVQNCCNPYLEFHHFDPPWNISHHHNSAGMIALCSLHHRAADGGAYTRQQLRELKKRQCCDVTGRFEWRRNDLIMLLGGSIYKNFNNIISNTKTREKVIWVNRDDENNLLLNIDLNILLGSHLQRLKLLDNIWYLRGNPKEFRCPPSGKEIFSQYENGDKLWIRFDEITNAEKLKSICVIPLTEEMLDKKLPLTLIRIDLTLVEIDLKISTTEGISYRNSGISPGFIFDLESRETTAIGIPGAQKVR